jgi:hypothetical protein
MLPQQQQQLPREARRQQLLQMTAKGTQQLLQLQLQVSQLQSLQRCQLATAAESTAQTSRHLLLHWQQMRLQW